MSLDVNVGMMNKKIKSIKKKLYICIKINKLWKH